MKKIITVFTVTAIIIIIWAKAESRDYGPPSAVSSAPSATDALSRVGVAQHRGMSAANGDTVRLDMMKAAKVNWARDILLWWSFEPAENYWNYGYADMLCKGYDDRGINLHLTLGLDNNVYNISGESRYAPVTVKQVNAFLEYVRRVAENSPNIKEFEIWNEPNRNNGWRPEANAAAYCALLRETAKVIREVNPDARIIAGAASNIKGISGGTDGKGDSKGDGARFLREMAEFGVFQYIDGISAHPYFYTNYSESRFDRFLELYSETADAFSGWKDFQASEVGWPNQTGSGVTEEQTAARIVKAFVLGDDKAFDKVFIYNFVNSGEERENPEHNFGLLMSDLTPKPGYYSLSAYAGIIGGADYLGKTAVDGSYIYLFHREGTVTGIAWSETAKNIQIVNNGVFDMYGEAVDGSGAPVELTETPVYIKGIPERYAYSAVESRVASYLEKARAAYPGLPQFGSFGEMNPSQLLTASGQCYESALDAIDSYANGTLSCAFEELMLCVNRLHRAGEAIYRLYAYSGFSLNSYTASSASEAASAADFLKSLSTGDVSGTFPYAEAILRQAKKYSGYAADLLAGGAQASGELSMVRAKDETALWLCLMARRVAEIESRDFDAGFYARVSPDVIKESGVSKVRLSVKNLNSVNIAADAVICGETGEILEIKPNITLDAGNAVDIEFNIAIPEDLPGRHYFYSVKLTDRNLPENKLLLSRAVYIDLPSMGPVDAVGLQGLVAVTPEENIFTVDGRRYLLIDAPGKGESAYFVMSLGNHGTRPFSADGTQRFNPSNPASVAYYLNNTPGLIPGNIAAYINRNHKWLTEGGYLGGDCPNDYYTTCGVALLSFAEFRANAGKIGLGDEIFTRWWLRTVRGANSWWDVGLVAREAQMRINEYALSSAAHIRPVFWLGEVFFKNVKISGAGENVLKALNPLELMSGGLYSPDEMAALCGDMPFDSFAASPQNSGINVTFTLKSGVDIDVLAAVYSGGSLVYAEFLTGGETPGFVPANTADTVKIMVWDNNMKPLFPALIYIAV